SCANVIPPAIDLPDVLVASDLVAKQGWLLCARQLESLELPDEVKPPATEDAEFNAKAKNFASDCSLVGYYLKNASSSMAFAEGQGGVIRSTSTDKLADTLHDMVSSFRTAEVAAGAAHETLGRVDRFVQNNSANPTFRMQAELDLMERAKAVRSAHL